MGPMKAFRALDIAGAGMTAERRRLEVIAGNIANVHTLKSEDGGPYRRREVLFKTVLDGEGRIEDKIPSVEVEAIVKDQSDFRRVHDPGHPMADADGYVAMPNVDMVFEMVDMMEAMRAYEADLRVTRAFRQMVDAALEIGR